MTDDAEVIIDVAPVESEPDYNAQAVKSRREHLAAIERVLDAIEPLKDTESEIEVLCHALLLVGARNASTAALGMMDVDL
jgi:hypothetical protein